jgi:hypothetical protein
MRVTNDIPLGCALLLPVDTVNCVQTLKDRRWLKLILVLPGSDREIVPSWYGARFQTGFCTRGCHWIPRMFA